MSWSLIANTAAVGTTSGINTTGATLIVLHTAYDGAHSISDSKGNAWTGLTARNTTGPQNYARLYYCVNPTVGSGHTFTVGPSYASVFVQAWSGNAISPFDVESGSSDDSSVTSLAPGSITPTQDDELVIAGWTPGGTNSGHSAGGFTVSNALNGSSGVSYGGFMGYQVQTSASAANPTGSWTGGNPASAVIASFKGAAASAVSGSLAVTLGTCTLSSAGAVELRASLSAALAGCICSAAGTVAASGSLSKTLADSSLSSAGTNTLSGSLSVTLGALTQSSAGTVSLSGQAPQTLADAAQSAAGTVTVTGSLAAALDQATSSAAGTVTVSGAASITLADTTLSATNEEPTVDDAFQTLFPNIATWRRH